MYDPKECYIIQKITTACTFLKRTHDETLIKFMLLYHIYNNNVIACAISSTQLQPPDRRDQHLRHTARYSTLQLID